VIISWHRLFSQLLQFNKDLNSIIGRCNGHEALFGDFFFFRNLPRPSKRTNNNNSTHWSFRPMISSYCCTDNFMADIPLPAKSFHLGVASLVLFSHNQMGVLFLQ
jgi:hypothetical protein